MEKFDQMKKEVEEKMVELKAKVADDEGKLNIFDKETVKKLYAKTQAGLDEVMKKVEIAIRDVKEDEKVNEFLEKVKERSLKTIKSTESKIKKIVEKEDKTLEKVDKEISRDLEKTQKEIKVLDKAKVLVNDTKVKIQAELNKPENKEKIAKAKKKTVEVAEKGLAGLKKLLKYEEEKQD